MNAIIVYGVGHYVVVKTVISAFTRLTTFVEAGVFNVNETRTVVKKEDEDESVRATEAVIVPAVEDAVCMFKQLSFWSELYISPYT